MPLQAVAGPGSPVEIRTNKGCRASFGAGEAVEIWVRVAQRASVDVTFVRSDGGAGGVLERGWTVEPGAWTQVPIPAGWLYASQWEVDASATDVGDGVKSAAACSFTVEPPPPE